MTDSSIRPERLCDAHDGALVVFVIGMRINWMHRPDKWMPVARAMPRMLKELMPGRSWASWGMS